MDLSSLTWTDAADVDATVALLPVGSTEQHGPHAPLGTDCLTAEAVTRQAIELTTEPVIVAPTIPIGVAAEHRHFAGTLWVGEDTFRSYITDTVQSLATHGWNRVIVVNGHGGNVDPLREACAHLCRSGERYAVAFTWFDAIDTGDHRMGHGGPIETAAIRHLHPELVRNDRLDDAASGGSDTWGEWHAKTNLAYDTVDFSENGVIGDPRTTDAADGQRFLTAAATALVELIDAVRARPVDARSDGSATDG